MLSVSVTRASSQLTVKKFDTIREKVLDQCAPAMNIDTLNGSASLWFSLQEKKTKQERQHAEVKSRKKFTKAFVCVLSKNKKGLCDNSEIEYFNSKYCNIKNCKQYFQALEELMGIRREYILPTNIEKNEPPDLFFN